MVFFHLGIRPANELAPGQALPVELVRAIREVVRRIDGDAVEVEGLDVMVVVGGQDLELGVVVDVTDAHVQAVAAEAVVAGTIAICVVPLPGLVVVPRPRLPGDARRLEQLAVR